MRGEPVMGSTIPPPEKLAVGSGDMRWLKSNPTPPAGKIGGVAVREIGGER